MRGRNRMPNCRQPTSADTQRATFGRRQREPADRASSIQTDAFRDLYGRHNRIYINGSNVRFVAADRVHRNNCAMENMFLTMKTKPTRENACKTNQTLSSPSHPHPSIQFRVWRSRPFSAALTSHTHTKRPQRKSSKIGCARSGFNAE